MQGGFRWCLSNAKLPKVQRGAATSRAPRDSTCAPLAIRMAKGL
ncbi:hypothetical protein HHE03_00530 [Helicobacter heilmannii]|uniref:Uncharacterized protein n=1 Tax=Helicobacter heilmannii TaxID=35817 RepID=A0A0K2XUJ5_HELHE|nr:hypothetical protein HHE03_00530 [Helicobacter heilmannii]CRI33625.1 hypothetical protein HHE01_08290 [Helicobacter heilmannii]